MSAALSDLTPEERAQLGQMQSDDAATEQQPEPSPPQQPTPQETRPETTPPTTETPHEDAVVSKRALDEARSREREWRQRYQDAERKSAAEQARVEERLRLLMEAAQAHVSQSSQPAVETPPPDFNTDPAGFIQHGFKQIQQALGHVNERIGKVETGASHLTQLQREQQAQMELHNWGVAQEAEFARETPDYRQAAEYLYGAREKLLRAMGQSNPAEIRQTIANDVSSLAVMARERGQQFGKVLYDLAVAHGYRQGAQDGPGTRTAPVADNAAERLLRGQDMATTLGSTGAAPRGQPAPQHIANMSDEEFAKFYTDVRKQGANALRNLLGA